MKLRTLVATILSVAIPLPAFAQPHVIAQLGTSPLVGRIASTAELQNDVSRESALFRTAGVKLGLTPEEYARFAQRIASRQVSYVTIPRHVDAMSWASNGSVYVLHDVVLPENTRGWEIDLTERGQVVALFVPARCGNLSLLRKPLPALAQVPPRTEAAVITPPPAPTAAPTAAPAPPVAAAPAVQLPPTPAPVAAPAQSVASSTPATHRTGFLPLLLIPLVAFLASHGGRSGNTPIPLIGGPPPGSPGAGGPPPGGGPTPPPGGGAGCPTPSPASRF
ncbi:MAG TPA: hypothetical protein VGZ02_11305 [Candidatus Baltobacteraceae bacterium]|nr:hypothetical protein [Candidatus Baltobacteraceae bacterium]